MVYRDGQAGHAYEKTCEAIECLYAARSLLGVGKKESALLALKDARTFLEDAIKTLEVK